MSLILRSNTIAYIIHPTILQSFVRVLFFLISPCNRLCILFLHFYNTETMKTETKKPRTNRKGILKTHHPYLELTTQQNPQRDIEFKERNLYLLQPKELLKRQGLICSQTEQPPKHRFPNHLTRILKTKINAISRPYLMKK